MKSLYSIQSAIADYEPEPGLTARRVGDHLVIINPANGAWGEGKLCELAPLLKGRRLSHELGEWAVRHGLARRTGISAVAPFIPSQDLNRLTITYNVTSGCNLHCVYCCADAHADSPQETASTDTISHMLMDRVSTFYHHNPWPLLIVFCGGEPLLNFAQIREIVLYAKERYPSLPVKWAVQTNLTLLHEEHIIFFKEHHIHVAISIDGFAEMHDAQRPNYAGQGSYATVSKNARRILADPDISAGLGSAVVTRQFVNDLPRAAEAMLDLGFRSLSLQPVLPVGRGNEQMAAGAEEYADALFRCFTEVFIPRYLSTGQMPIERYLSLAFSYLMEPARYYECEQTPCIGARNMLAIASTGDVYPCNQALTIPEFRLGHIGRHSLDEILDSSVAQQLRARTVDNIAECRACQYRGWCQSPCPVSAWAKYGRLNAPSGYCHIMRARADRALEGCLSGRFPLDAVMAMKAGPQMPTDWVEQ